MEDTVDTAYLVLLLLLIVYIPIYLWVRTKPEQAERYHLVKYGPCIMIRTKLGIRVMERLGKYTRFWRAFGFVSKVITAVLLIMIMYMVINSLLLIPARLESGVSIGIEYALAIPGFNPMLPLSYGVVALVIAMVVHELGHGIQARANKVDVDASGLLYAVVPLGAFVDPNAEQMEKASRRTRMDIFAAGITVNTAVAVVAILLLSGMGGTITSDYEDDSAVYRVDAESPAYDAGIPTASIITAVNGIPVDSVYYDGQYSIGYDFDPTQRYSLTYQTEAGEFTANDVQMGTYIRSLTSNGPAYNAGISYGQFLYSIDGVNVTNTVSFLHVIRATEAGDVVSIGVVDRGSDTVQYYELTLGTSGSGDYGFLGVTVTTGGITIVTPGYMMDVAMDPFYGATDLYSHFKGLLGYLSGPFNGMDPVSDEIKWWYDVPTGDIFWILLSLLYWVFWLNLLLGISNALPAYPFDGGHLFSGFISWLLEKTGYGDEEKRQKATDSIMNSVSTLVLFMFGLVIVAMLI